MASNPSSNGQGPSVSTPPPNAAGPSTKEVLNDPKRTGFDPSTNWWMNYFRVLSGQMTKEGQFHFREWNYKVNEEKDCKRCEDYRDWLFTYSPTVRFLQEKIEALNGDLNPSNVLCRRCPARIGEDGQVHGQGGGFSPSHGILICANQVRNRKHMEDTLSHEMVHAWDHLRWKVDWMGDLDLKHAACTEIRAAMLSGECRWSREAFMGGNWGLTQHFQSCIRRRATASVMARPRCKDREQAAAVVDKVWDSCFADTRPFDEVFR